MVFGEDVGGRKGWRLQGNGASHRELRRRDAASTAPLAEASIIGVAVGMAAAGWKPIPEIQFADYIHPAFDQIVSEVARVHYRSNGAWTAADGHSDPVRRRHPRCALSLPVDRGLLRPRARAQGRDSFDAGRRQRAPVVGLRGSRSGAVPGAQEAVSAGGGARFPREHFRVPLGRAAIRRSRVRPDHHHLWRHGPFRSRRRCLRSTGQASLPR